MRKGEKGVSEGGRKTIQDCVTKIIPCWQEIVTFIIFINCTARLDMHEA